MREHVTLQRLVSYIQKPYQFLLRDIIRIYSLLTMKLRLEILFVVFLMFLQAATELLTIMAIRDLGMAPSNPAGLSKELHYQLIFSIDPNIEIWALGSPERFLLLVSIVVAFFVILKNIVAFYTMRTTARTSENVSLKIGSEMMERYLYSSYRWHISKESGIALQMMLWRNNLASLLIQQLSAVTGFVTCTVLFGGLIIEEPMLSLAVTTTMVSTGIFLYVGLRRNIDKTATLVAQANVQENVTVMAATRGIRDVLIYGQQPAFLEALVASIQKAIHPKVFLMLANSLPSLLLEAMGFLMIPITVFLLSQWNAGIESIISAVMLLVLTAWRVLPYLNRGIGQMVAIRAIRPMALPVLDFLRTLRQLRMELPPPPNPNFHFSDKIELVEASFTYPDATEESLHAVTLTIPKGKLIGLIGPSGAGKSTVCNIISCLCRPTHGQFLVDGAELDAAEVAAFHSRIGFVPQSPFLMNGSLAGNVAFSQWGKPWDAEKVIAACKQAAIDFITFDEQGILHPIGENGSGLSGGQAQRVSIARALYAAPEIIIFDEATSALDMGNENIIVSSIEKLRGKVTCIIIAHRMSTVEHCDIIYWFDRGRIVASGPPQIILPQYVATFDTSEQI